MDKDVLGTLALFAGMIAVGSAIYLVVWRICGGRKKWVDEEKGVKKWWPALGVWQMVMTTLTLVAYFIAPYILPPLKGNIDGTVDILTILLWAAWPATISVLAAMGGVIAPGFFCLGMGFSIMFALALGKMDSFLGRVKPDDVLVGAVIGLILSLVFLPPEAVVAAVDNKNQNEDGHRRRNKKRKLNKAVAYLIYFALILAVLAVVSFGIGLLNFGSIIHIKDKESATLGGLAILFILVTIRFINILINGNRKLNKTVVWLSYAAQFFIILATILFANLF